MLPILKHLQSNKKIIILAVVVALILTASSIVILGNKSNTTSNDIKVNTIASSAVSTMISSQNNTSPSSITSSAVSSQSSTTSSQIKEETKAENLEKPPQSQNLEQATNPTQETKKVLKYDYKNFDIEGFIAYMDQKYNWETISIMSDAKPDNTPEGIKYMNLSTQIAQAMTENPIEFERENPVGYNKWLAYNNKVSKAMGQRFQKEIESKGKIEKVLEDQANAKCKNNANGYNYVYLNITNFNNILNAGVSTVKPIFDISKSNIQRIASDIAVNCIDGVYEFYAPNTIKYAGSSNTAGEYLGSAFIKNGQVSSFVYHLDFILDYTPVQ
jgi:hypothetical protein